MSLNTDAQTRTSVRHKSAIITPSPSVMIWNLKHSPQQFHRVSLPSPHLHKLHVLLSPSLSPHVSGTFSMALNATVPYFIEGVVGWGQNPPQRRAMRSCIRDVSFGTRGPRRMERKQKKMREAGACFSLFWRTVQEFLFCISFLAPSCCKGKTPSFPHKYQSSSWLLHFDMFSPDSSTNWYYHVTTLPDCWYYASEPVWLLL